jgi:4-hydroxy-4-methyl-2-oxoglutarate aldolase
MAHVIRNFSRPERSLVEQIAKFEPSTLYEAQGRRGALDSRIKPLYPGMAACGTAVTARCHPGDNLMLQVAISLAKPGDILVVAAANAEQGAFGEVLATACHAKGIVGLVTDGGVRDGQAILRMGFPVFSPGLCMKGTVKETLGTVNQPVVIGGVLVRPGDIIAGDDDGLVLVLPEEAAEVARKSEEREAKEARSMEAFRKGADVLETLGMDKVLAAKKCTYEDQ